MGRVCVITGGTSGIGLATAQALVREKIRIVIIGRDPRRGARAVRMLEFAESQAQVELIQGDIASLNDVRRLANVLLSKLHSIDVLVNNAGARFDTYGESIDGIELTYATNHLGHFLLTHLLMAALQKSGIGRVITVSSVVHRNAVGDGRWESKRDAYNKSAAYAESKLANVLFAFELARRMEGKGVVSNSVDPGIVATGFARNNGLMAWAKHNFYHLVKRELRSSAHGADTVAYLATSADGGETTGKLFRDRRPIVPSPHADNEDLARGLWEESERIAGLEVTDRILC